MPRFCYLSLVLLLLAILSAYVVFHAAQREEWEATQARGKLALARLRGELAFARKDQLQQMQVFDDLPRVFVYEPLPSGCGALPSLPEQARNWDSLEAYLYSAFSTYAGRVSEPEEADFFFVPHAATLKYHGSSYNQSEASCHFHQVLGSVAQHPYAARSAWADHIVPWAHDNFRNNLGDAGADLLPWALRHNAIFIVNQGDDGFVPAARFDLMVRDFSAHATIVTLPPSWTAPQESVRSPWRERKYLAVFRGSLLPDLDYSNGVRQTLMAQFAQSPHPQIVFENHSPSYAAEMHQAKFCIFIKGWTVWSERLGTLINAGCVPVIISDHYSLPFSRNLDWTTFSLRLSMADAVVPGRLLSFLLNVSDERGMELEANLTRIQPSLQYNLPPVPGDIFDFILLELTQRLRPHKPISGLNRWGR